MTPHCDARFRLRHRPHPPANHHHHHDATKCELCSPQAGQGSTDKHAPVGRVSFALSTNALETSHHWWRWPFLDQKYTLPAGKPGGKF